MTRSEAETVVSGSGRVAHFFDDDRGTVTGFSGPNMLYVLWDGDASLQTVSIDDVQIEVTE